jgi:hypothetical protein
MEDGMLLVTDYKTGSLDVMPSRLEKLRDIPLTRESLFENVKSFQVPLYFNYMARAYPGKKVNAALYNLRTLEIRKFMDYDAGGAASQTARTEDEFFTRALEAVVSEILDKEIDFVEESQLV